MSSSEFVVQWWSRVDRRRALAIEVGFVMALLLAAVIGAPAVGAASAAKDSSPCSKVGAASVGKIVGKSAPAETSLGGTVANSRSVESGGNLSTQILCVYGDAEFTLTKTVASEPVTVGAIKTTAAPNGSGGGLKVTVTPYSGHGVQGFRFTSVQAVRKAASTDEIGGISGTTVFAAQGPFSLPVAKLAALAKLAKKL